MGTRRSAEDARRRTSEVLTFTGIPKVLYERAEETWRAARERAEANPGQPLALSRRAIYATAVHCLARIQDETRVRGEALPSEFWEASEKKGGRVVIKFPIDDALLLRESAAQVSRTMSVYASTALRCLFADPRADSLLAAEAAPLYRKRVKRSQTVRDITGRGCD